MHRALIYSIFISLAPYCAPSAASRAGRAPAQWLGAPASFDVEWTLLLSAAARRHREVGFRLRAALAVRPTWAAGDELLLRLELSSCRLLGRGSHPNAEYRPVPSVWDSAGRSAFYARTSAGRLEAAYLDADELVDVQNFKRSLIGLLQFQTFHGEINETDASGECEVQYETLDENTVRKIKRRCHATDWDGEGAHEVASRRLARYSLGGEPHELRELHAEELHELGAAEAGAGLKLRSVVRLTRRPGAPGPAPLAADLPAALAALPAGLLAAPLPAPPPAPLPEPAEPVSQAELLRWARAASGAAPGAGGTLEAARGALRLLAALRTAGGAAVAALLHDGRAEDELAGLCAALGLLGEPAAHGVALRFLRLRERDAPPGLAHVYFAALGLAERPHDAVLEDALRLAAELHDARLAESALLAAAAASRRASPRVQRAARDALLASLAACPQDACRRVRLAALGNLRRADAAEPLLRHAERDGTATAALAALDALADEPGALGGAALRRLERLALEPGPLERRAAALDVVLRASADAPFALPRVLEALEAGAPHELRRLARGRLLELAERHEHVRRLLAMLPLRLRSWNARALAGTSSVLTRCVLRAGGGCGARLEAVQVSRGGLLRRARVRLLAADDDTLAVELWTTGLEAFAGTAAESEPHEAEREPEPASGGLALAAGGARLPEVTLFDGQAELLGHVWAGTGSEPTAVLRVLRPLPGARVALPVLGGAALRYRRRALLALALDAHAQVSLWSRGARAHLALRGALAAEGAAWVEGAAASLRAEARAELQPRLAVGADLDFYAGAALCVRAAVDRHERSHNVTLTSELGSARRRVRREHVQRWAWEGRTLALGAPNDATCRTMGAGPD